MPRLLLATVLILAPLYAVAQNDDWQRFALDECEAEVMFPDQPELTVQRMDGARSTSNQYVFAVVHEIGAFSLHCSDPILDTDDMPNADKHILLKQGVRQRIGDNSIEITTLLIGGQPAIDFVQPIGGGAVSYHRWVLANQRLYNISASVMTGTRERRARQFLDSFRLPP